MERYDHRTIEAKWQAYWEQSGTFRTPTDDHPGPHSYVLDMFPYPSGSGLHVGHPEGYTATDIICRYRRARGHAVLHPMGWDAFGLPAEQHAIQTGTHPRQTTEKNVANFRRQLKMLGFSYDWEREIDTTDPAYVKWTQWIFLVLFRRGLAYQSEVAVNWCPALGTVLANEEVVGGVSERGGHPVDRVPIRQWVLRITAHAERLLAGLQDVDWPSSTRTMQQEWIGRSEGALVRFAVNAPSDQRFIEVYTTRPDTLFGATFLVLAPEHPLVAEVTSDAQRPAVDAYVERARSRSELTRQSDKEKTGVWTGGYAVNPVNGENVPIWIADYVLMGYGTGAIMAVPGHDERDFEFAKRFDIPIVQVVSEDGQVPERPLDAALAKPGRAIHSGPYDGLETAVVKQKIVEDLEQAGTATRRVQYKLRDWVFSRQRYWGEPIPIYFPVETEGDPRQGDPHTIRYDQPRALDESELPLLLPELDDYKPGADPAGVLARAVDWRFFERDGQWFARETNTMPQWAGSCWYYLRFLDPANEREPWTATSADRWLPVDLYVGGAEHAVLHLLYARFWHQVLYDEGLVRVAEPFYKLVHQGMILGEIEYQRADGTCVDAASVEKNAAGKFVERGVPDGELTAKAYKMSKSRGNVVNPDDIVEQFGADSMRVYEMFMGPLEATKPWNTESIGGVRRFLDRAYSLSRMADAKVASDDTLDRAVHRAVKKVTEDIETMRFNTAISALMVLSNELHRRASVPKRAVETLTQLLHPFAPHLAEEMWEQIGNPASVQDAAWPAFDPALCEDDEVEIPVQINGKKRGVVKLSKDSSEDQALVAARAIDKVQEQLEAGTLRKTIWVPGRILNLIVK